ncbi:hypothetical protein [Streptomyces sp. CS014]|uniref:hypothetical protein n=1 Tax=Streptomyces sp. CS014 TaxID=2162707 RepID=UPI0013A57707|nr:hypothetical protein [Streptomyces sp. CS014]
MTRTVLPPRHNHENTPRTGVLDLLLPTGYRRRKHLTTVPDLSVYDPAEQAIRNRLIQQGVRP